ncbi:MAG: aminotransferase class V-fold PLP-dependent enzyme, partial [Proteobacteria bacterium]|nr:aminotransferase class V-fold PLP-dependent enzyme [Pseudomonadota bacterium]
KPGDRILAAEAEYAADYRACLQRARRDGLIIDVVPSDDSGVLDTDALEAMIDERVGLIAMTWIPTNGGLVNPAEKIGEIATRHGIPYLLDACQAVGQMPVDVRALGCDFLSATGRKFLRGPRGTGFLYVRKALIETFEPVMIDMFSAEWVDRESYSLRGDARRFETWENPYALRLGLGEAARYACSLGLSAIQKRAWALTDRLREALDRIPKVTLRDTGREQCAIASFSIEGADPTVVAAALRSDGINISVSRRSSTRLDAEARSLPDLLRASPHYYNTEDEIDRFVAAIRRFP